MNTENCLKNSSSFITAGRVKALIKYYKEIALDVEGYNAMVEQIIRCKKTLKESESYNELSVANSAYIYYRSCIGENPERNHIAKESSSDGSVSLSNKLLSAGSKIIKGDFSVSSRYVFDLSDDASDTIDRSVFLSFIKNEIAILESMQLKFGCLSIYEKGLINRLSILMK